MITYEFRVDGHLDDHWSAWLGDLSLVQRDDGTSTLTGPVADQAQLHGVLTRLRDIGATLLSVRAVEMPRLPDAFAPASLGNAARSAGKDGPTDMCLAAVNLHRP